MCTSIWLFILLSMYKEKWQKQDNGIFISSPSPPVVLFCILGHLERFLSVNMPIIFGCPILSIAQVTGAINIWQWVANGTQWVSCRQFTTGSSPRQLPFFCYLYGRISKWADAAKILTVKWVVYCLPFPAWRSCHFIHTCWNPLSFLPTCNTFAWGEIKGMWALNLDLLKYSLSFFEVPLSSAKRQFFFCFILNNTEKL